MEAGFVKPLSHQMCAISRTLSSRRSGPLHAAPSAQFPYGLGEAGERAAEVMEGTDWRQALLRFWGRCDASLWQVGNSVGRGAEDGACRAKKAFYLSFAELFLSSASCMLAICSDKSLICSFKSQISSISLFSVDFFFRLMSCMDVTMIPITKLRKM